MILKGRILHCMDYDLVHPQHFIAAYVASGVDEEQCVDLEPYHLRSAVIDILAQMHTHGRRVDSRTTWWGETDMVLDTDADWDDADDHHAVAVARG